MPTIYVPPGSKVTVRTGPSKLRLAAAAVAGAMLESMEERERERDAVAAERARRRGNRFAIGDVVGKHSKLQRNAHGEVCWLGEPGLNEQVGIAYGGQTTGHAYLAERYHRARYSERRDCTFVCCRNWNSLPFLTRWRNRNKLLRDPA